MNFVNLSLAKNSVLMQSLIVEKFILYDDKGKKVNFNDQKVLGTEHEADIMKTPFSIPAG